jgi:hypothetical protein
MIVRSAVPAPDWPAMITGRNQCFFPRTNISKYSKNDEVIIEKRRE